jgi:hypothetical protein
VDESGATDSDRPSRRFVLLMIALMTAAVAFPFVYSAIAGDRASSGWMLVGPPALGATGAVIAWRAPARTRNSRSGWMAASIIIGLSMVPVVYIAATLIEAIDWTVNGPPF